MLDLHTSISFWGDPWWLHFKFYLCVFAIWASHWLVALVQLATSLEFVPLLPLKLILEFLHRWSHHLWLKTSLFLSVLKPTQAAFCKYYKLGSLYTKIFTSRISGVWKNLRLRYKSVWCLAHIWETFLCVLICQETQCISVEADLSDSNSALVTKSPAEKAVLYSQP